MRKDIIELFTDIDDDLIANAMPEDQRPVELRADTRRFSWGKFAAAAACLAVIAVGGTFALKAVSGRGGLVYSEGAGSGNLDPAGSAVSEPANSVTSEPMSVVPEPANADHSTDYPEEAKYQYKGDFSELKLNRYEDDDGQRHIYQGIDELIEKSDLVVVGTFVDDAWQNRPTDSLSPLSSHGVSFNKLRIDRVFYGNAEVGDEIVVSGSYFVCNGELLYPSNDGLTPMIKGEQWVHFLVKQLPGYGDYYVGPFADERYPVPGNENTFVLTGTQHGVFDEKYFREDIYEDVKKMLGYAGGVEKIEREDQTTDKEFTMPEFPEDKFVWTEKEVLVSHGGETTSVMFKTPGIPSLYLADLNGDGKRELIAVCLDDWTEQSARYIAVYDHENKKLYPFHPGSERSYDLEMRDNELYVVTRTIGDGKEISSEPMMVLLEKEPLVMNDLNSDDNTSTNSESNHVEKIDCEDQTAGKEFTMPEFPEDRFIWKKDEMLVSHNGETASALYGASNIVNVYLADLNGDGKRELVNLCRKDPGLTANEIMVCDYANSKLYTIRSDANPGTTLSYELEIKGRELYVVTRLLGDYEAISSEPLTLDMLSPITRCGLDDQD